MAILYPKNYLFKNKPQVVERNIEEAKIAAKKKIQELVVKPMNYEEIIKEVQKTVGLTNDELLEVIKEVDKEWNPPLDIPGFV